MHARAWGTVQDVPLLPRASGGQIVWITSGDPVQELLRPTGWWGSPALMTADLAPTPLSTSTYPDTYLPLSFSPLSQLCDLGWVARPVCPFVPFECTGLLQ